jgi:ABC-type spermidine/putrescine transport system permease subunit I
MTLGFPLAAFLATQDGKAAAVALGLITASLWISILVKVYSWQVLLAKAGPINALLGWIGITSAPIPFLYTRGAVVIGMVQFMLPYAVMLLYAGMRRVDWELMVAARTLGAGLPTVFWQVYWPQVSFTVITAAVIVFVIATSFFVAPALLGGPGETMLGMQMKSDLVNRYDSGMAATSGVALTLILLAITWGAVRLTGTSFRRLATEVVR